MATCRWDATNNKCTPSPCENFGVDKIKCASDMSCAFDGSKCVSRPLCAAYTSSDACARDAACMMDAITGKCARKTGCAAFDIALDRCIQSADCQLNLDFTKCVAKPPPSNCPGYLVDAAKCAADAACKLGSDGKCVSKTRCELAKTCDTGCKLSNGACVVDCSTIPSLDVCKTEPSCLIDWANAKCAVKPPPDACEQYTEVTACVADKNCQYNKALLRCEKALVVVVDPCAVNDEKACIGAADCLWDSIAKCITKPSCDTRTTSTACTVDGACKWDSTASKCVNAPPPCYKITDAKVCENDLRCFFNATRNACSERVTCASAVDAVKCKVLSYCQWLVTTTTTTTTSDGTGTASASGGGRCVTPPPPPPKCEDQATFERCSALGTVCTWINEEKPDAATGKTWVGRCTAYTAPPPPVALDCSTLEASKCAAALGQCIWKDPKCLKLQKCGDFTTAATCTAAIAVRAPCVYSNSQCVEQTVTPPQQCSDYATDFVGCLNDKRCIVKEKSCVAASTVTPVANTACDGLAWLVPDAPLQQSVSVGSTVVLGVNSRFNCFDATATTTPPLTFQWTFPQEISTANIALTGPRVKFDAFVSDSALFGTGFVVSVTATPPSPYQPKTLTFKITITGKPLAVIVNGANLIQAPSTAKLPLPITVVGADSAPQWVCSSVTSSTAEDAAVSDSAETTACPSSLDSALALAVATSQGAMVPPEGGFPAGTFRVTVYASSGSERKSGSIVYKITDAAAASLSIATPIVRIRQTAEAINTQQDAVFYVEVRYVDSKGQPWPPMTTGTAISGLAWSFGASLPVDAINFPQGLQSKSFVVSRAALASLAGSTVVVQVSVSFTTAEAGGSNTFSVKSIAKVYIPGSLSGSCSLAAKIDGETVTPKSTVVLTVSGFPTDGSVIFTASAIQKVASKDGNVRLVEFAAATTDLVVPTFPEFLVGTSTSVVWNIVVQGVNKVTGQMGSAQCSIQVSSQFAATDAAIVTAADAAQANFEKRTEILNIVNTVSSSGATKSAVDVLSNAATLAVLLGQNAQELQEKQVLTREQVSATSLSVITALADLTRQNQGSSSGGEQASDASTGLTNDQKKVAVASVTALVAADNVDLQSKEAHSAVLNILVGVSDDNELSDDDARNVLSIARSVSAANVENQTDEEKAAVREQVAQALRNVATSVVANSPPGVPVSITEGSTQIAGEKVVLEDARKSGAVVACDKSTVTIPSTMFANLDSDTAGVVDTAVIVSDNTRPTDSLFAGAGVTAGATSPKVDIKINFGAENVPVQDLEEPITFDLPVPSTEPASSVFVLKEYDANDNVVNEVTGPAADYDAAALNPPVTADSEVKKRTVDFITKSFVCSYWDDESGTFKFDGVTVVDATVTETSTTAVRCSTTHLTEFVAGSQTQQNSDQLQVVVVQTTTPEPPTATPTATSTPASTPNATPPVTSTPENTPSATTVVPTPTPTTTAPTSVSPAPSPTSPTTTPSQTPAPSDSPSTPIPTVVLSGHRLLLSALMILISSAFALLW